ncbi:exosome nuclease subunit [Tulasnella sp. 418]|nr:exosome nuclease subunit [Tulasnella sp. 418]
MVNLFDTYDAAAALEILFTPGPTPISYFTYANNLWNALIDRANGQTTAIYEVLERSEKTALNTYVKESYDAQFGSGPDGWDNLARKWNKALFGNLKANFIAIHAWRDKVARVEDESTKFVLPNRFLFSLAERPPMTIAGLLIMVQPASPIVKARTQNLLTVIKEASETHVAQIEASKTTHSTGGDVGDRRHRPT